MKILTTIKPNTGFTLIEIVVAILIIGSAFVGIIQAFPFSVSIIKTAESETLASYLAQEKLEELNQKDYTDIGIGIIEPKHRLGATGTYLYPFQRQTEAIYVDGDLQDSVTDQGLKKVISTVFFTNSISRTEKTYSITTLFVDR